jgi:hypothetical protein
VVDANQMEGRSIDLFYPTPDHLSVWRRFNPNWLDDALQEVDATTH